MRKNRPVTNLSVVLSEQISAKADFWIARPDVTKFFGLEKITYPNFTVGWVAEIDGSMLQTGCHEILLRVDLDKDAPILINSDVSLWIEG